MRFVFYILLLFLSSSLTAENLKNIVFIAGEDSHGHGEHEYRAGCHLLAKNLNKSGLGLRAVVVEGGWPKNTAILDKADSIIVFSNGREQHPFNGHFEYIDKLIEKGAGIGFFHDAFNVLKDKEVDYIEKWIGGYYEKGFSTNPKWELKAKLNKGSSITNGVKPFKVFDEWHFNINFKDENSVQFALTGVPDAAARSGASSSPRGPMNHIIDAAGKSEALLWVKDKENKRGFGFSGGHYHEIWKNKNVRTLVLNAIVWSAGVKVPLQGVSSKNPDKLELSYRMSPSPEEIIWSKELANLRDFKLSYKSPVIKGDGTVVSIDKQIDLTDAKELVLVVLDGGDGITKDHSGWLNPELTFVDDSKKLLTEFTWDVAITGWREIRINHGVESEKLIFNKEEYQGISTHALSLIRYKLPKNCKNFKVKMALLDSNAKRGSVQFEIYVK